MVERTQLEQANRNKHPYFPGEYERLCIPADYIPNSFLAKANKENPELSLVATFFFLLEPAAFFLPFEGAFAPFDFLGAALFFFDTASLKLLSDLDFSAGEAAPL